MAVKVVMPQLGESVVEGTVMKWLRQEGETIHDLDLLVEIETDKVATEIPCPAEGTVLKILVPEGETVRAGSILAWIGTPGEVLSDDAPPANKTHAPQVENLRPTIVPPPGHNQALGFISPLVARLAHEYNVDLYRIQGTGEGGRITKKDVLSFVDAHKNSTTAADSADAPWDTPGTGDLFKPSDAPSRTTSLPAVTKMTGDQLVPISLIRKTIAEHMLLSRATAAHVTTVMEADMLRVSAHRQNHQASFEADGVHLTFTAYFAAAVTAALKAFPMMNASWSEQGILQHSAINPGLAVSLGDEGLIVPVIRDAANLSLLGLARAVNDLAQRARSHQLNPDEVKGGTFTITNHGTVGSLFATPIINQPQVGIMGVGMIKKRVVAVEGDAIAVHPMVYLSLSFDHRIMDGAYADAFLACTVQVLEQWH